MVKTNVTTLNLDLIFITYLLTKMDNGKLGDLSINYCIQYCKNTKFYKYNPSFVLHVYILFLDFSIDELY